MHASSNSEIACQNKDVVQGTTQQPLGAMRQSLGVLPVADQELLAEQWSEAGCATCGEWGSRYLCIWSGAEADAISNGPGSGPGTEYQVNLLPYYAHAARVIAAFSSVSEIVGPLVFSKRRTWSRNAGAYFWCLCCHCALDCMERDWCAYCQLLAHSSLLNDGSRGHVTPRHVKYINKSNQGKRSLNSNR
ncbi:uncharacterized protein LOC134671704 [Cydia fagiglandana]|uniref:uncharacterized protein LOC134671704 n=1 Tax=Cydia fagiglandana TaxID=1458189 RepID=UPI002FEDEBF1